MQRVLAAWAFWVGVVATASAETHAPDFAQDILPIFRRHCFECHGPNLQEAGLRLDDREAALSESSAIVPGDAENSELLRRISLSAGHAEIMPAVGKPLSRPQIAAIRQWIDDGAPWPENVDAAAHWAYAAPVRPALPEVDDRDWPRNPVDRFILERLSAEGLKPSEQAAPANLLRRVYLDLIGLPPTPAEVDAFLNDDRDDAYEAVVDRLLNSPQFGERWARPWLDLARYADSHGFQRDDLRQIWPYRDWVIRALNADMPFDQFTIEQLAGDLLPSSTEQQLIATGFHRCTMTNVEAGADPEETRTNQVIDRVNTTATVWLGSTLECAQCHDHKFDPFTQEEYYRLFAFFNNTAIEADRANPEAPASIRFLGPRMTISDSSDSQRKSLRAELESIDRDIAARTAAIAEQAAGDEKQLQVAMAASPKSHALQLLNFTSAEGAAHRPLKDGSVLLLDDPPDVDIYSFSAETDLSEITALKLEALTDDSLPGGGPGRGDAKRPNFVLNELIVEAAPRGSDEFFQVKFVAAAADFSQRNYAAAGAVDGDPKTAWAISPRFFEPHWALFTLDRPLSFSEGVRLRFRMEQRFGGGRTIGRVRVSAVTGDPAGRVVPAEIARIAALAPADRSKAERRSLVRYQASQDVEMVALKQRRAKVQAQLQKLPEPTTLVMKETSARRQTAVFAGGDYRQPAGIVEPGVPAVLQPPLAPGGDRVALAQWLVDRRNPLTARVTVNRWWAEIFGHGIVETVEDFGIKGEPPTHPELLDWLAVEFMDAGWSMKHILRLIVTSAAYRQSSHTTPAMLERDDKNRFYARGPRLRMDAEMIRDNALAVSGLLSKKQYGPPIRPYQPDGLWRKVGGAAVEYVVSPGEEKFRRGIYVVLKRSAPYPSFVNFDASGRFVCTAKRSRSNTPLQALTLLNDPVYVEAAGALAARAFRETASQDPYDAIDRMVRLCLCRDPAPLERDALRRLFEQQLADGRREPEATRQLVGSLPRLRGVSPEQHAAGFAVATALLNLDETITKD